MDPVVVLHYYRRFQALSANIRLGCKCVEVTNTIGYIATISIRVLELFYGKSHSCCIQNTLFSAYLTNRPSKLVLDYIRQERIARGTHTGLLGQIVSFKENEVLWIWSVDVISTTLYFLWNFGMGPNKLELHYTEWKNCHVQTLSLIGPNRKLQRK